MSANGATQARRGPVRCLVPDIPLVEHDVVFVQELPVLLLKRLRPMMLLLSLNVMDQRRRTG